MSLGGGEPARSVFLYTDCSKVSKWRVYVGTEPLAGQPDDACLLEVEIDDEPR